ncbi:MAG: D-alanyl-D-alanine carboxypeptidase/D-alanyl-D-alanine-endopeptidase, partial [Bifidobacteriaceae bacterium]|nr:D-alanyl-D-alanine carboxypeptidase/D-alanyl-D-alanine-endopeptidase [Bifidobacteriaceae bacterium]
EPLGASSPTPDAAAIEAVAAQTVGAERLTAEGPPPEGETTWPVPDELTGAMGVSVRDLITGEELFASNASQGLVPASTLKILTAAAALSALGPDATLTTAAVLSRGQGGSAVVTLVAGGDTTLGPDAGDPASVMGRAGMGDLAREAATGLRRSGASSATVTLDDTVFSGPATYPDWGWGLGTTWGAPATPLAILDGRAGEAFDAVTYVADPALRAAEHFAALLAQAAADPAVALPQVTVDVSVTRAAAPAEGRVVAEASSAPIRELVGQQLRESDNTLSEALGRAAAVALGHPGSFEGCAAGVGQALGDLGVPTAGLRLDDCSGLSHGSRIPASTLTGVLALTGGERGPEVGGVARGLAVGGLQGTVAERFTGAPGAGNVRAKTGTLTGVTALAGLVQTAAGRELAFALIANPDPQVGTLGARNAMDRFVEGLAALR